MPENDRIQQLVEAVLDGSRTPEEICADCPELLPAVAQRLRQVHGLNADLQNLFPANVASTVTDKSWQKALPPGLPSIPGYDVLGVLGRGGMGVVYQARQNKLNRLVALKMILAGSHAGPAELARFQTEGEAIARLQHPNIVQVHEVGEHEGKPFFSLEFCGGGSLERKLNGTPLRAEEATTLVETLARATQAAHDKDVIHRDLKPANVLLTEEGTPKITDFGLAKKLDEAGQTGSGAIMGSAPYMSPEQAAGKTSEIGPATDIYALGAILYECLTGRPPFKAATTIETIRQVVTDDPVPPSQLQTSTPRDLETICLKCLRKEPAQRYISSEALANDLKAYLAGEPIQARPPSLFRLALHTIRRFPTAATLLASMLMMAVAITGGAVWHSARLSLVLDEQTKARSHAEESEGRARQLVYVSDLALVSQLIRNGNFQYLSEVLDRHEGASENEDRRDFAYYYARQFRNPPPPPVLQADFSGPVRLTAFSPNNRLLLAAGGNEKHSLRVWDTATGQTLFSCPCQENLRLPNGIMSLTSLSTDGKTLAIAHWVDSRPVVRLLDPRTGQEKRSIPQPGSSDYLRLTADSKTLITVGEGKVQRWDTETGQPQGPLLVIQNDYKFMMVSPDGKTMAVVASADRFAVRLWDLVTGMVSQEVKFVDEIDNLSFTLGGEILVIGLRNRLVHLLGFNRSRAIKLYDLVIPEFQGTVAIAPDGHTLAFGCDKEVWLLDLQQKKYRNRLKWQEAHISSLAYSPDGQKLAVGTDNGLVHRIWVQSPPIMANLEADLRAVETLAVSHDGRQLAVPDLDGSLKLMDLASGSVRCTLSGYRGHLQDCQFTADDRLLATIAASDNEVHLWDTETGQQRRILRGDVHGLLVLALSPDGSFAAAGDENGSVFVWDLRSGQRLKLGTEEKRPLASLAFRGDSRVLGLKQAKILSPNGANAAGPYYGFSPTSSD